MSKRERSNPSAGNPPRPRHERDSPPNDFERSNQDIPIDDPGDAQRSSKSEPDGDGEETDA